MATIKSFTDLSQSKTLSKILLIESADMYYEEVCNLPKAIIGNYIFHNQCMEDKDYKKLSNPVLSPAWSLAALLSVLPFHLIVNNQRYAFSMYKGLDKDGEIYMLRYNVFNTDVCLCLTDYYNSPIDACVDMIEKLNELNLL